MINSITRFQPQSRLHDDERGVAGNCTEAALATVFGIPLTDIPVFHASGDDGLDAAHAVKVFWDRFDEWLASIGYLAIRQPSNFHPECVYLASGPSPRGRQHMVVYRNGKLWWDPHPSRVGLQKLEHTYLLVPEDPFYARRPIGGDVRQNI